MHATGVITPQNYTRYRTQCVLVKHIRVGFASQIYFVHANKPCFVNANLLLSLKI